MPAELRLAALAAQAQFAHGVHVFLMVFRRDVVQQVEQRVIRVVENRRQYARQGRQRLRSDAVEKRSTLAHAVPPGSEVDNVGGSVVRHGLRHVLCSKARFRLKQLRRGEVR